MDILVETDRLVIRPFGEGDSEHLVELDSDPEVMRYLTGGKTTPRIRIETAVMPRMLRDYERYPGFGAFPAFTKAEDEFIGWFMLVPRMDSPPEEAELGYRLRRAAWGKGYATEGAAGMIRYGFEERGLRRIWAETMAANARSRRVMEKLGLRYELTYFPPFAPIPGSEDGEVVYGIDHDEWLAASQRKNLHDLS
jgi:RimJ/RimL family protein N-acetyltransferase